MRSRALSFKPSLGKTFLKSQLRTKSHGLGRNVSQPSSWQPIAPPSGNAETDQEKFQQVKSQLPRILPSCTKQVTQLGQTERHPTTHHQLLSPFNAEDSQSTIPPHGVLSSLLQVKHTSRWGTGYKLRQGCCCQRHPHLSNRKFKVDGGGQITDD